ncbi:MAG: glycyl-tRNA synthetase, partial [Thermococcaceae archaeon]|nr:glycyl-tRNA synthetase [Thermococcaceae archaeon]
EHGIKCPECGGELSDVWYFNLMFETYIGPYKDKKGYLRPETAQGIFVNFKRLNNFARNQLPFGVFQIGKAYRNEISPRQGMLRLREFTQAEAEIFFNPNETEHPHFDEVKDEIVRLYPIEHQLKDLGSPRIRSGSDSSCQRRGRTTQATHGMWRFTAKGLDGLSALV